LFEFFLPCRRHISFLFSLLSFFCVITFPFHLATFTIYLSIMCCICGVPQPLLHPHARGSGCSITKHLASQMSSVICVLSSVGCHSLVTPASPPHTGTQTMRVMSDQTADSGPVNGYGWGAIPLARSISGRDSRYPGQWVYCIAAYMGTTVPSTGHNFLHIR
jgi:hypothetical protein